MEDLSVYQPPVPHYDQGGITQRRGSRPPAEPVQTYDPYGRTANDPMSAYQQPPQPYQPPPPQTNFMPQNTFTPAAPPVAPPAVSQPPVNIFTPDFTQSYGQAPPPSASGGAPPSSAQAGKFKIKLPKISSK